MSRFTQNNRAITTANDLAQNRAANIEQRLEETTLRAQASNAITDIERFRFQKESIGKSGATLQFEYPFPLNTGTKRFKLELSLNPDGNDFALTARELYKKDGEVREISVNPHTIRNIQKFLDTFREENKAGLDHYTNTKSLLESKPTTSPKIYAEKALEGFELISSVKGTKGNAKRYLLRKNTENGDIFLKIQSNRDTATKFTVGVSVEIQNRRRALKRLESLNGYLSGTAVPKAGRKALAALLEKKQKAKSST